MGNEKKREEQRQALLEAAKPLIKYLSENHHPHVKAIVEPDRVELVEGVMSGKCEEYIQG